MCRSERLAAMRSGELGSIHSWELVTAVDGPGTRMTVFLSGCPLRCLYCHNPDTLKMRDGTPVMTEDLLNRITRYKSVFDVTGGGVTFSGGEPMMQPAFLSRLLAGCRDLGIHTTIDTSGFLGANASPAMLRNLDLVLLDVKSGDPDTYRKVTGRPLEPTIAFGQRLCDAGVPMWIRYVLVPGLTDEPRNIAAAADIVSQWDTIRRVEVLPFHQMAKDKWHDLGMTYQLADTEPPTKKAVKAAQAIFRSRGLTVY
ncbi:MAG: pyruvate formate-lyase-activating protein [Actinomycetaceae bacterium]|nr:pyruvate formate-lyase-activating protein [Actinomycetaceae bacterium]